MPLAVKKMRKYFPYFPFVGVIFLTQFPSGLSLNWAVIAVYNYFIIKLLNKKSFNKLLKIPEYFTGTNLEK